MDDTLFLIILTENFVLSYRLLSCEKLLFVKNFISLVNTPLNLPSSVIWHHHHYSSSNRSPNTINHPPHTIVQIWLVTTHSDEVGGCCHECKPSVVEGCGGATITRRGGGRGTKADGGCGFVRRHIGDAIGVCWQ